MRKITILVPSVWSGVYYNTARLLKYSLEDNGIACSILEAGECYQADLSILLGWNLVPDHLTFNNPFIIYQLEPLHLEYWKDKLASKFSLFEKALTIWDYSSDNQRYLSELGLTGSILQLGYHFKMQEIAFTEYPDYDVLFVGFVTERRHRLLEELNKYCCVSVQPRWGADFKNALGRSKILLNIHQYNVATPLEQPRIAYALNNHCFVLSEVSTDNPYQNVMTCKLDNLIDETLHYLHDIRLRNEMKNKAFEAFKTLQMSEQISELIKKVRDVEKITI